MKIETIVVGPVQTNCYIVSDEASKQAILIDPGEGAQRLIQFISKNELTLTVILLTHGHFDHIMAAKQVASEFGTPIYCSEAEEKLANDMNLNCSMMFGQPAQVVVDLTLKDDQVLNLLGSKVKVIATPGHTSGSVCYYFEHENVIFTGDTLFFESIGRTDFPTGNGRELMTSIQNKLFLLPKDTIVYSGHGCETSIGHEINNNPYVTGV